jgi:hypothetical protein
MAAMELKAELWQSIQLVEDETLLRKLANYLRHLTSTMKEKSDGAAPHKVNLDVDSEGRIILPNDIISRSEEAQKRFDSGEFFTEDQVKQRFSGWL